MRIAIRHRLTATALVHYLDRRGELAVGILSLSGLAGTLIGAGVGSYLGYVLSVRQDRKTTNERMKTLSEALAFQILYQVQLDIAALEAVKQIALDVGTPPTCRKQEMCFILCGYEQEK